MHYIQIYAEKDMSSKRLLVTAFSEEQIVQNEAKNYLGSGWHLPIQFPINMDAFIYVLRIGNIIDFDTEPMCTPEVIGALVKLSSEKEYLSQYRKPAKAMKIRLIKEVGNHGNRNSEYNIKVGKVNFKANAFDTVICLIEGKQAQLNEWFILPFSVFEDLYEMRQSDDDIVQLTENPSE